MKTKTILSVCLVLLMLVSCTQKTTESSDYSTVKGTIYYEGEPVAQALVRLSNSGRYDISTSTDESGNFEFVNVTNDTYTLKSQKTFDDGSFVELSNEIDVEGDLNFDNLVLPDAVVMLPPTNPTTNSLDLSWTPTNAADFREYKIYSAPTSGLDETTGLLVHVSTQISDTTFVNTDLNPNETYFYRVYVMNQYVLLGGSNIVNASTDNMDIILNGSFEILEEGEPTSWEFIPNDMWEPENYIFVDTEAPYDGDNSLKFHHNEASGYYEQWIQQYIDEDKLVPGAEYMISFAYKSNFSRDTDWNLILRNETIDLWLNMDIEFYDDNLWHQYEGEFSLPDNIGNNDVKMCIHFENEGIVSWWIDDIKILRVD